MALTAGLSGVLEHGCAALLEGRSVIGVCEQERATRQRNAGFNSTGLPDEALDLLLTGVGRTRRDVDVYAIAAADDRPLPVDRSVSVEHHLAHASTSYFSSPFTSAAIVVCDGDAQKVSVWRAEGLTLTREDWPWRGLGFTDIYDACAATVGFSSYARAQRFEALARLCPTNHDARIDALFSTDGTSISVKDGWQANAREIIPPGPVPGSLSSAKLAAALQSRIAALLIEFLRAVRARLQCDALCVGGGLFHHSSINTVVKRSQLFSRVFVPVAPGDAGLAVGSALRVANASPQLISPFLGPTWAPDQIKATLDNCKLRYDWMSDDGAIATAVSALNRGMLVGWFEGAMEWGSRALGGRSILASPLAPYVLENLNAFLKNREPWRGYALSTPLDVAGELFDGPSDAPFMECDFRPHAVDLFARALPAPDAAVRVHTVSVGSPPRFRALLDAFGAATGKPVLVNTSFNGFHEPIVCSPRDAVRVFYGTGLDVLILDGFVLSK